MNSATKFDAMAWKAFQYVAGEMNARDAATFEACLLESQQLREEVAAAVALGIDANAAIRSLDRPSVAKPPATRRQVISWPAVAASIAILLVSIAASSLLNRRELASSGMDNIALAIAWSELRQDNDSGEGETPLAASSIDRADDDPSFETSSTDVELPGWLRVAVEGAGAN